MRLMILLVVVLTLPQSYAETILIGIPPFTPPFVMKADDKGHFIGFSIDIMTAICMRMKVSCQYQSLGFEASFKAVMDQKVDLAIGNFTITPEREEYVLFSIPYLESQASFLTLDSNPFSSIEDLRGKTVGAEHDSIFIDYIEKRYGSAIKVIPYPIISEAVFALSNGDISAVILDRETAQFWVGNNDAMFKVIDPPIPMGLGIGIMANKDNQKLITRINETITDMQSEGSYLNIYNMYFGEMKRVTNPLF